MLALGKYSIGFNNSITHPEIAQLAAIQLATNNGIQITPVWNKTYTEHLQTKSTAAEFQNYIEESRKQANWKADYFIDSENITNENIEFFLPHCNYFTFSISDFISNKPTDDKINKLHKLANTFFGTIVIDELSKPISFTENDINLFADKYLGAIENISKLHQVIQNKKGNGNYLVEISAFDLDAPLSTIETFFLFASLFIEKIPVTVFTPRFSGQILRSIDFIGNIQVFENKLVTNANLLESIKKQFNFSSDLKIGIHQACDKPSLYPIINKVIKQANVGIHIKTAGSTWLTDCTALIQINEDTLDLVKSIYAIALNQIDLLSKSYINKLKIDKTKLPTSAEMFMWPSEGMKAVLTIHDKDFNPNLRQLMSIAFNIAAEYGAIFTECIIDNNEEISKQHTISIYESIIKPILID